MYELVVSWFGEQQSLIVHRKGHLIAGNGVILDWNKVVVGLIESFVYLVGCELSKTNTRDRKLLRTVRAYIPI